MITITNLERKEDTMHLMAIPEGTVFTGSINGRSSLFIRTKSGLMDLDRPPNRPMNVYMEADVSDYKEVDIEITIREKKA